MVGGIFALISVVLFLVVLGLGGYVNDRLQAASAARNRTAIPAASVADLEKKQAALNKKIGALAPKGLYLVIDTGRNELFLKRGNAVVRKAVVSTGSGVVLQDPKGNRSWVFDTPRGEYQIRSKATDPNWVKPDWAFIEEGEPIPTKYGDRVESGMLGDYALGFGNGYFIHGTLYTRLLGRNVTHGCVRVGDEDLEEIYKTVPMGTRLFIF